MGTELADTIADIRGKLADGRYTNEEHVRVGIVLRMLQDLGWDVWNPAEVYLEFPAVPAEDASKVDIALFVSSYSPTVYIEVKSLGRLTGDISAHETQLRDYNRNNTALFSLITDGQKWRFYYSQTGGEFSSKCFKSVDLLTADMQDLETVFTDLLSSEEIASGNSRTKAEYYLQLNQKQRVMEDQLPQAKKAILESPYPTLPQALVGLAKRAGLSITEAEASDFISEDADRTPPSPPRSIPRPPRRKPTPTPADFPVALAEILEVSDEVLNQGRSYNEATKIVTSRRGLRSEHTVPNACTRLIGLNTAEFRALLEDRKNLARHLSDRFPEHESLIRQALL